MSTSSNIQLYPWYQAATGFLPWMPVFFLYFSNTVSLDQAIELGAIYYLAVVFFEVPSGYLSDRLGRRTTLLTAATFAILAYSVFLFTPTYLGFALGQCLLAAAIAFQSGSDNSLLYDSLKELQRESEYETHEARAQQYSMTSLALSVLLGGVFGSMNLKFPYAIALITSLFTWYLCWNLTEPARTDGSITRPFFNQLGQAVSAMRNPVLTWVLFFYVAGYCLQHIPYEFYQPYITLLKSGNAEHAIADYDAALVSGIVIGLSMFGGALGATVSRKLGSRFGAANIIITGLTIQSLIIAIMSLLLHPLILTVIVFRNFSMSMTHAPMHGLIAPRVQSAHRATYLSLQSLFGRLAFSSVLFVIASRSGELLDWPTLSVIFKASALAGAAALLVLLVFRQDQTATDTSGRPESGS